VGVDALIRPEVEVVEVVDEEDVDPVDT